MTPFEGPSVDQMTEPQLAHVNRRWQHFFEENRDILYRIARGDEDLVSMGLLSVRRMLCQHPDCPLSWLIRRAYLDILRSRGFGCSVDTPKLETARKYPLTRTEGDTDITSNLPETYLFDTLQYREFWEALTPMEQRLLELLKEEKGDENDSWYQGEYVPVARRKGQPRRRFHAEVSPSETDYKLSYAHVRYQFYLHFGQSWEVARERTWLQNWSPEMSLHASRNGKCQHKQKGKANEYRV